MLAVEGVNGDVAGVTAVEGVDDDGAGVMAGEGGLIMRELLSGFGCEGLWVWVWFTVLYVVEVEVVAATDTTRRC